MGHRSTVRQSSLHTQLPVGSQPRGQLQERLHPRTVHGGEAALGRRKTSRPWNPKAPVHLVLKSSRARGAWSLLHRKHKSKIQAMIYRYAERFQVRVYRATNVGNHLHLLVKAEERKQLADFLRVLAGRVAVTVSGAKKGVKRIGKFWDFLTFSRLVNWGRDFFSVREQLQQQLVLEAFPYLARLEGAAGATPPPPEDELSLFLLRTNPKSSAP